MFPTKNPLKWNEFHFNGFLVGNKDDDPLIEACFDISSLDRLLEIQQKLKEKIKARFQKVDFYLPDETWFLIFEDVAYLFWITTDQQFSIFTNLKELSFNCNPKLESLKTDCLSDVAFDNRNSVIIVNKSPIFGLEFCLDTDKRRRGL